MVPRSRSGWREETHDRISELHGNNNREYCKDYRKNYTRGAILTPSYVSAKYSSPADFYAVAPDEKPLRDHRTGRKRVLYNGNLLDSAIHFGEVPPEQAFE